MTSMSEPMIVLRDFLPGDRERLYAFLGNIWPERTHEQLDRRWWWWAVEQPPLLLALGDGAKVIGMCGYLPLSIFSGGERREGAWVIDYFVLPEHQGKGIGKRFVADLASRFEFLASLNQTDAAWAAFVRSGWRKRTFAPLFIAPSSALTSRLARLGAGANGAAGILAPAEFGDEFDRLWERVRDRMPPLAVRSATSLSRRFAVSQREYSVVRGERGGELRGYMVVRALPAGSIKSFSRFPIALIADHLTDPDDPALFSLMLKEAAAWASRQGIRFMLCMATNPRDQRRLHRAGFLSPATPVMGRKLSKLAVGFTATAQAPQPEPWHLTPFDCDLDLLFGPR
jgi:GNAT superfamily N-acetyltransferase